MKEDKFTLIKAIEKEPVSYTPIWIMRQAGRYLPEYRELRKKYDFLEVCKTPRLAAEVTLQPLQRFDLDAAILFSDILVVPEALGQKLTFKANHGPVLKPSVDNAGNMCLLDPVMIEQKLDYVAEAIKEIKSKLNDKVPLIGFSGSPFTLATYMIEGSASKNFRKLKQWAYSSPDTFIQLLDMLCDVVTQYLKLQINAGVDVLQVFDTWGTIIPLHLYHRFSGRFLQRIIEQLKPTGVPCILFTRGGLEYQKILASYKPDMISIDWTTDIQLAYDSLYKDVSLQGNLDPTVLYGSKDQIEKETMRILNVFGTQSGHVFNLGHGILPDIPVENVKYLVDTVKKKSKELHN